MAGIQQQQQQQQRCNGTRTGTLDQPIAVQKRQYCPPSHKQM
jgi:hypothetical protein